MSTDLSRSIAGKTILVTGAASGIGRATARLIAGEGGRVVIADINAESLNQLRDELRGDCLAIALDVSDTEQCHAAMQQVISNCDGLYGLVNNAGISTPSPIDAEDYLQLWDRAMSVLLSSQMKLIRLALPTMRAAGIGRIVNLASTEGLGATPQSSTYTVAKHGVIGLTRSMAVELGGDGITVNCICPGPVNTNMTQSIKSEHKQIFARRRVPLGRYAEPEEIAHAILHLLLPASSYINGVALPVDGGMTIKNA